MVCEHNLGMVSYTYCVPICAAMWCCRMMLTVRAAALEIQVRALFRVARCYPSSVVFVDEIDSLLTARSDGEQEATRRVTALPHRAHTCVQRRTEPSTTCNRMTAGGVWKLTHGMWLCVCVQMKTQFFIEMEGADLPKDCESKAPWASPTRCMHGLPDTG